MENDIIDDFQSGVTQSQTDNKRKGLVKTFGWISFGIAIFYLFSGLISLFSSSMLNSFSKLTSIAGGSEMDFFARIGSLQTINSILTLIAALLIIVGAIGFVTFNEWGRKLYIGACTAAIMANFFGVFIAIYSMSFVSEIAQSVQGMNRQEAQIMEGVAGTFGGIFAVITIVFSLIPITYLVINVFIAINLKTKALMS